MSPRFSGDPEEFWAEKQGNPVLKAIFARSWFLVIPLIAVWWFEAKKIDVQAKLEDVKIAEERHATELTRTKSLGDARKMGVHISLLKAVGDTFLVRFAQADTLLDSLRVLVAADRTEIHLLEAQAESLRAVYSGAEAESKGFSDRLAGLQARVDSLRNLIVEREESTRTLASQIAADQDLADRILRPDAYRKNSALLTGPGDFPNRDALPKR